MSKVSSCVTISVHQVSLSFECYNPSPYFFFYFYVCFFGSCVYRGGRGSCGDGGGGKNKNPQDYLNGMRLQKKLIIRFRFFYFKCILYKKNNSLLWHNISDAIIIIILILLILLLQFVKTPTLPPLPLLLTSPYPPHPQIFSRTTGRNKNQTALQIQEKESFTIINPLFRLCLLSFLILLPIQIYAILRT